MLPRVTGMPEVVLLVGLLVTLPSLLLLIRVELMRSLLQRVFGSRWLFGAALLRLFLGAALIGSAHTVRYPLAVEVCGWLLVFGALMLVVIPAPALRRMAERFANLSAAMTRVWLCLALGFGLWLVYAALA